MNAASQALSPRRRWPWLAWGLALAVAVGIAIGELLCWPFLAAPLQRVMSDTLDRRVILWADTGTEAELFGIRFIGGLQLRATQIEIGAPEWSTAPHLLRARELEVDLRYVDLWRAYFGQPLRLKRLHAKQLHSYIERLQDGRASWQFRPATKPPEAATLPLFDDVQVVDGWLRYSDLPLEIDIEARMSLSDTAVASGDGEATADAEPGSVLQAKAEGRYRKLPLKIELVSVGKLAAADAVGQGPTVTLVVNATVGRATLVFEGHTADALRPHEFGGRFRLKGPSLAAVGDLAGVTLPTTVEFQAQGQIGKRGEIWTVEIDEASVGASRLDGAFTYDAGRGPPLLSGRLGGKSLALIDLGPALGKTATADSTRVLPARPFDLAALRAMNADVMIDIDAVDLNTELLQPLRPLRGELKLSGGVLTIKDLDARTAQGRLQGDLRLDGRGAEALWNTTLRWDDVRLEQWVRQARDDGSPPFVSGELRGRAALSGKGRSTAEILASLQGDVRSEVREGMVSHLVVEAAGLDVFEALGVIFTGDKALQLECAVADLVAEGGELRPRVMVLDTTDSTIWIDGSLSLATESLDLRAVVTPKDFSPVTLRTPLRVRGSFADPQVSLEKRPAGLKLAGAFLLGLVNPLAALIPLIDTGSTDEAASEVTGCEYLRQRSSIKPQALNR